MLIKDMVGSESTDSQKRYRIEFLEAHIIGLRKEISRLEQEIIRLEESL